jgi:hypothetical protein
MSQFKLPESVTPEGLPGECLSLSMLAVVTSQERLARLRRYLSGFSHRCRNSLNGIKVSLYLARREPSGTTLSAWEELEQTYLQIERLFDRLQAIYRPMTLTMVRSPLGPFMADHEPTWRTWFAERGRTLRVDRPGQDLPGDFDPIHLGMGLDAVLAWRADVREAGRQPRLSWRTGEGFCEVAWDETETPTSSGAAEAAAGCEGKPPGSAGEDPLALPLLARIITAHAGRTESTREPGRGFRLNLSWPQFRSQSSNADNP